jgi:hypothetical protein
MEETEKEMGMLGVIVGKSLMTLISGILIFEPKERES